MNTMMMALLQGRLWDAASSLQQQLRAFDAEAADPVGEAALADELQQVIHALEALRTGRYGQCHDCGQALEPDQLLMQPHRLRCMGCEAQARTAMGPMPMARLGAAFRSRPSSAAGAAAS
jgi:RNA polymerase-binding transcription factor DksA